MKIALISLYLFKSLSTRQLSAFLKQNNQEVYEIYFKELKMNDLDKPTRKEIKLLKNLLKKLNPDIIGLSINSSLFTLAKQLTKELRDLNKPIIWGGLHPTLCPEDCIKEEDMICIGEGEQATLNLLKNLEKNKPITNIKSIWVKKDKKIYKNKTINFIEDLDSLPTPNYDNQNKFYILENKIFRGDQIKNHKIFDIMMSRGYPYNCSYCNSSHLFSTQEGKKLRFRSIDNIIKELTQAKKQLKHIKRIRFWDNILSFKGEELNYFARQYKTKINLPFECNLHPEVINDELIRKLKKAGMDKMSTGIQDGSQKVRYEIFNRKVSNEQIIKACKILQKNKITPNFDIIINNPLVTEYDLKQAFKFLIKIPRPFNLIMYSLTHFPKTKLTEELLARGIINKNQIEGQSSKLISKWRATQFQNNKHQFWNSIYSLISKNFIPKPIIIILSRSKFLKKHSKSLNIFAFIANIIKIFQLGIIKLLRGEMDIAVFKRYKNLKRITTK